MGKDNRYKISRPLRNYIKAELMNYTQVKSLLKDIKDTRALLIATKRVEAIERVFNSLSPADREVSDLIFISHYSQAKAECINISYKTYYNTMNKVIYLTAKEYDLI